MVYPIQGMRRRSLEIPAYDKKNHAAQWIVLPTMMRASKDEGMV
jgi:hypothetical protein